MKVVVPRNLLDIPAPFDIIRGSAQSPWCPEWTQETADAALTTVRLLVSLYLDGYPEDGRCLRDGRFAQIDFRVRHRATTYFDIAHAAERILPVFEPERGVTLEELEAYLEPYVPRCAHQTAYFACDWLGSRAYDRDDQVGRLDWPGSQALLDLAQAHWRELPAFLVQELVCAAGALNQERALGLLEEVYLSPDAPEIAKGSIRIVGASIVNPIDPEFLRIPERE